MTQSDRWYNLDRKDAALPEEGRTVELFVIGGDGKGYLCEGRYQRVKSLIGHRIKWEVDNCPAKKVREVFAWRFKEEDDAKDGGI